MAEENLTINTGDSQLDQKIQEWMTLDKVTYTSRSSQNSTISFCKVFERERERILLLSLHGTQHVVKIKKLLTTSFVRPLEDFFACWIPVDVLRRCFD